MKSDNYTLITGASKGLGYALANECAQRKMNLILVALPNEGIVTFADQLMHQYSIQVITKELDLINNEEFIVFMDWLKEQKIKIDFLINNAGMGGTHHFETSNSNFIENMIQLNMNVVVKLCHHLLPILKRNDQAYILNVASLAAFSPMPFKAVYSASKTFVSSFSKSLNAELKGTGVSVSVCFPGGMATTPELKKRMDNYKGLVKLTFIEIDMIAKICIDKTLKSKRIIIPGLMNKLSSLLLQVLPENLRFSIFRQKLLKEIKCLEIEC